MKILALSLACFALVLPLRAEPAHALTVGEGFTDPLGYHDAVPRFSWKLPANVAKQSAFRVLATVADGRSWDSGWMTSDQSVLVPYGGPALKSRDRVTWKIDFRNERGREGGWSAPAQCELGLLSNDDWKAQWIRPSQKADSDQEPVGMLRRQFKITKPVARARVYVTARGLFELRLNGQRIGRDHFANGFTSYPHRLDTLTYDVTPLLRVGDDTLEGLLGSGWYAGRLPFGTKHVGPFGTDTGLLVQLEIVHDDGSTETVVSDCSWEGTFSGPIVSSSLYDGEVYDARRQPADWAPVVAEANLGNAALRPKPFEPVRETQTLAPRQVTERAPGQYVFDLGQNMVGWARLRIPVEQGKTVTVRFAEMLQSDGSLYTENYRTAKSTDHYTAAETGSIEWEPHFTFHGFRYVELSGLPAGAVAQKEWVTGVVLHSDLRTIGEFRSSHAELNQLQSNIAWGWRGNSVDIPTDCPQRDERMGWTGDAEVFSATSMFNTDGHAFWKSWLGSMRDDQASDGTIPMIIPNPGSKSRVDSPGWMDAAVIIPWNVYVRTGDKDLLAENYAMMERLVAWYRSQAVNGLLPTIKGFGDWLQPFPTKEGNRSGDTPFPLLGAAFYAHDLKILADSARALGRRDDEQRYRNETAAECAAFTREYFDADGREQHAPETQTAYVLAIAFDLIPAEMKAKAAANLERLVHEAGGHLRTGFLGTSFLAAALDDTGHSGAAADLLFQHTYPSWFYPIDQGATTMWERWNSYTLEKGFGDAKMNSFNHYAYGAIGQWLYERIAGLAPDSAAPGYKHFVVRPLIVAQLDSASAELDTPYGKAASRWEKVGDKVVMKIVVPPNTTATVEFPDGRAAVSIEPGEHRFECGIGGGKL